jgi:MFS family permease
MTTTAPEQASPKTTSRPSRGEARLAFIILFSINILNYTDRFVLPAVLPKIREEFGLTTGQQGLLGTSFLLVYALATLPLGIWADRSVRTNIVALCVGVWSVATAMAGLTRNFIQLFLTRAVLGIGEAGYAPASLSLLADYFPKAQRGRILSYWSSGTLIGAALGFTLGGLVADRFGWRWAFYIVGIPGLILAFLAWRLTEPKRGAFEIQDEQNDGDGEDTVKGHGAIGAEFWSSAGKIFKIPTYLILLCALTASFFAIGGTSFWLPSYFVDAFHLKLGLAGLISGGVLVGSGLVGTLTGGWLADYLQRRRPEGRLLTATLGFLVGAPMTFIALFIHSLPGFVTVFIIAAIALNFCTGPLNAVIQDIIPPGLRATAVAVALLLAHLLGDAAAPSIIGFIAEKETLAFALITTGPTFIFLAGLVCLIGLRTVGRDMRRMQMDR